MASDATIQTKVQTVAGGDELAIASGGTLTLESGSTHTAAGTRNATGVDNINSGGVVNVKSGATVDCQSGSTHTAAGTRNATGVDNINSGGVVNVKSGATVDMQSGSTHTAAGTRNATGTDNQNSGSTIALKSGATLDRQAGSKTTTPFISKAASFTVLASESGAVYLCTAVDLKATLPSSVAGLTYTFIVHTVSASTGLQIDPAAADAIMGNGLTSVDDKDLINTPATDAEGDAVTIVGDGADGWWIESIVGTWAKEA